jgi:hypothetical protein
VTDHNEITTDHVTSMAAEIKKGEKFIAPFAKNTSEVLKKLRVDAAGLTKRVTDLNVHIGKSNATVKRTDNSVKVLLKDIGEFVKKAERVKKTPPVDDDDNYGKTYKVKGSLPAPEGNLTPKDSSYKKAQAIFNAIKQGKNPHTAAQIAGIGERPSIIKQGGKDVYEFRLSHGGTQHRLNAIATTSGDVVTVEFKYLGPGH